MLINIMRTATGEALLEVRGEIDTANADRLRQALVSASRQRPTAVVVDLLSVTFIDSVGIGALAVGYNAARRLGVAGAENSVVAVTCYSSATT